MSARSHPTSSSSPSLPTASERKDDEIAGIVEEDDEEQDSPVSQSSQLQAQLQAKEDENDELRRELAVYRQQYKEDQKEERKRVIGHRVSLTAQRDVHGVTIVNESLPPPRSDMESTLFRSPRSVPPRLGRLTLSPPLKSPASMPIKPSLSESHLKPDAPADQGEEGEVEMTQKQRELLVKSMGSPSTFSGDKSVDKTADVRDWVEEVEKWLNIHVGPKVNKGLLPIIEGLLRGGANTWMTEKKRQLASDLKARMMKGELEWHEVREGFIEEFEGPQYRVLIREELRALRLWKGKCKSIPLFNSEFDRLCRRLYPMGQDLAAFIPVLAEEYGNCLRHSDEDLWSRVVTLTIPATVAEWRERAVSCFATREILKAQKGTGSAASPPKSTPLAQMSTDGMRGEGQAEAGLNALPQGTGQGTKGGGDKKRWPGPKPEFFLTEEEFSGLAKLQKCFICFAQNHRARYCPKKKETRRHPTAEELKQ
jgi:hypothetical protein